MACRVRAWILLLRTASGLDEECGRPRVLQEAVKEQISFGTRQLPSMASPYVLPERLLHKCLRRKAQPFRPHHERTLACVSGPTKRVSCKARKSLCQVLCQEDLPELQKVMLGSVMVHVMCVCVSLLVKSLEEHGRSSNEM